MFYLTKGYPFWFQHGPDGDTEDSSGLVPSLEIHNIYLAFIPVPHSHSVEDNGLKGHLGATYTYTIDGTDYTFQVYDSKCVERNTNNANLFTSFTLKVSSNVLYFALYLQPVLYIFFLWCEYCFLGEFLSYTIVASLEDFPISKRNNPF